MIHGTNRAWHLKISICLFMAKNKYFIKMNRNFIRVFYLALFFQASRAGDFVSKKYSFQITTSCLADNRSLCRSKKYCLPVYHTSKNKFCRIKIQLHVEYVLGLGKKTAGCLQYLKHSYIHSKYILVNNNTTIDVTLLIKND